jgi:hypothetical protein
MLDVIKRYGHNKCMVDAASAMEIPVLPLITMMKKARTVIKVQ